MPKIDWNGAAKTVLNLPDIAGPQGPNVKFKFSGFTKEMRSKMEEIKYGYVWNYVRDTNDNQKTGLYVRFG